MKEFLNKSILGPDRALELCRFIGDKIDLKNISGKKVDLPAPFALNEIILDKLIFFPGSFSPWHLGHSECIKKCPTGPIVIVPDRNPWKDIREMNPWDEICQIRIEIEKCERDDLFIDPRFLAKMEANPTSSWLPEVNVKKKWLLMGDDLFLGLHRWQDVQAILSCLTGIYVCPRQGNKKELEIQKKMILENSNNLEIVFLESHEYEHLSSTKLRDT